MLEIFNVKNHFVKFCKHRLVYPTLSLRRNLFKYDARYWRESFSWSNLPKYYASFRVIWSLCVFGSKEKKPYLFCNWHNKKKNNNSGEETVFTQFICVQLPSNSFLTAFGSRLYTLVCLVRWLIEMEIGLVFNMFWVNMG